MSTSYIIVADISNYNATNGKFRDEPNQELYIHQNNYVLFYNLYTVQTYDYVRRHTTTGNKHPALLMTKKYDFKVEIKVTT